MKPLHIAIVGYGSGGQACALLLSRDGHRVEVFEQAAAPVPVGAGFLLQPTGLSVLWDLGLLPEVLSYGAPITRLYGETTAGRAVMDIRYRELDPGLFGLGLQRGALFDILDSAWQQGRTIHSGCRIVVIDPDRGILTDANRVQHGGYDLVIVADGAASRLRSQVVPARLDRPYPWGAHWCLVEQGAWHWPDELQQRYVGARRMIGMLPVGSRPDDPVSRLSFFWSLPAAALAHAEIDAGAWRTQVAAVWPAAERLLRATDVPGGLAVARYRDVAHRCWSRGRAVLLGDAAHAMSPQLGQGVNMALLDARALRDALRDSESIAQAFESYARQRRRHVDIYHFWSRWLTPVFQSERDAIASLRDRLFHPLSRLPLARAQMLRVLTGTRCGWFGTLGLPPGFINALSDAAPRPVAMTALP